MLTEVKGKNLLQELNLDWDTRPIINLGTSFEIVLILFVTAAGRLKLQPIFSFTVLITIVQDKPTYKKR